MVTILVTFRPGAQEVQRGNLTVVNNTIGGNEAMISNAYFGRKPFLVFSECSPPRSRERHTNVDARSFLALVLPIVRGGAESTDPQVSRTALSVLTLALEENRPQRVRAV
jgi:hypothetical protein